MITFLLLIVGFLIGVFGSFGSFGSGVISAFTLVHYWIWAVAIVLSSTTLIFIIVALTHVSVLKNQAEGPSTKSVIFGTITKVAVLIIIYTQIWLSGYIIDNTPLYATSFSEIPGDTQFSISVFVCYYMVSILLTIFWARERRLSRK